MIEPRKPTAFRLPPAEPADNLKTDQAERPATATTTQRRPQAVRIDEAVVTPAEVDVFEASEIAADEPLPALAPRRRSWLAHIFLSALGILISLAVGLWTDRLIENLFSRADWLGWVATAAAGVALAALVGILIREAWALSRLASMERLHRNAREAAARNDGKAARAVVKELTALMASRPETAAGRRSLADLEGEIIDGADLIRIAEAEILGPVDQQARLLVLDAARRVSVVTAISPRALVDLAYVAFEASRLIRRIAALYGGRPGTLGFFRLARDVLAHLAVTGVIAAGDDFVHQVVGQGLAARLSAKLGEGVVNGMMTARIGIAAMDTVRPMPFLALKRPTLSECLAALTAYAASKATGRSRVTDG